MTIIHELLRDCADTGVMIKMKPTQSTVLTIQDVANTLWSSGIIATYGMAHNAAVDLTGEVGFELTSPRGKFWKRAKSVIQRILVEYSSETFSFTETDWASTFDTLRKMFGDLTGSTENITTYRTYWLCPVDVAMILGPKFSLHSQSCYWTSYADSFKQLLGSKGYMLRGVWGDNEVKDDTTCRYRIGSRTVTVPQFTDYQKVDTTHSYAARTWIIPLKNDAIAIFNGYKAIVTASEGSTGVWDFSPHTRDRYRPTNGEVVRFISTDLATHFMSNGIERAVVRSVPKRHCGGDVVGAFINMDAFSIVGNDNGEFMTSGYKDGLNIPDQAFQMTANWQYSTTPRDADFEMLDVRERDDDEDDEILHDRFIEHLYQFHDLCPDERNGIDWGECNLNQDSYQNALEEYRDAENLNSQLMYSRDTTLDYLEEHEAMTRDERSYVEFRLAHFSLESTQTMGEILPHLLAVRTEPVDRTTDHAMYVARGTNISRLYGEQAMTAREGELLGIRIRGRSIEMTFMYVDLIAELDMVRIEIANGGHSNV